MIGDVVWYIALGWTIIGFITLIVEILADGKFMTIVLWNFTELDTAGVLFILLVTCIGAWPIVWMYDLLSK